MRYTAESYAKRFVDEMEKEQKEIEQRGQALQDWMKNNKTFWHPYTICTVHSCLLPFPDYIVELFTQGPGEICTADIYIDDGEMYISDYGDSTKSIVDFIEKHNGVVVD